MARLSPQEVERRLGQQYAQTLRDQTHFISVRQDCDEVIQSSLNLLEHYNKVTMALRSKGASRKLAGLFS